MATTTLELYRGDDFSFQVVAYQNSGEVLDITNFIETFTVKEGKTDTVALIEKTSASALEINKTAPLEGEFEVIVDAADTAEFTEKSYYYDIQLTDVNGKKYTIIAGLFDIKQDITN